MSGGWTLRAAEEKDSGFLEEMLMEAFNWSPDRPQFTREHVLGDPSVARYVARWPLPGDFGVVAVGAAGEPLGACWARLLPPEAPGYGFVAEGVPELSLGVRARWRGQGVGRGLLRALVDQAAAAGHHRVSLSVERANHAHGLYLAEGFTVHGRDTDADTMVRAVGRRG